MGRENAKLKMQNAKFWRKPVLNFAFFIFNFAFPSLFTVRSPSALAALLGADAAGIGVKSPEIAGYLRF